ncbi:MAG: hypothetical protein KDH16_10650 [Rhodocyclaceae bacterium]|nr:hypothetical protein [Rhodocyclaceae bacterium]
MADTLRVTSVSADVLWARSPWDGVITDPPPAPNAEPRLAEGIYLIEVDSIVDGAGSVEMLKFTDSSLGFATRPTETPANSQYDTCVINPGYIDRSIDVGAASVGFGEVILATTGHLDYILDRGLDGQTVLIRRGPHKGVYPDEFPIQLRATMEQPEVSSTSLRLRLRDRLSEFDKAHQRVQYLGNNVLPNGLEGTADDIKGKTKPKVYGKVFNIEPMMVNTSKLIYQASDSDVYDIPNVYDKGAALTRGSDYTDSAAMLATAPSPGQYKACPSEGYFRLGAAPEGTVTCDVTEGATAADRYAGSLMQRIAEDAGVDLSEIQTSSFDYVDSVAPYEIGVYVTDSETTLSAISRVAESVGAWFGFDRFGILQCGRLEAPSGSPTTTIDEVAVTTLERIAQDTLPVWKCTFEYGINGTQQSSDLAGSVSSARKAWIAETSRSVVVENAPTLIVHAMAREMERTTYLVSEADAATEAARVLTLHSVRRDTYRVAGRMSARAFLPVDIGQVVTLVWPRFGLEAGKLMVVTGLRMDFGNNAIELTLWG